MNSMSDLHRPEGPPIAALPDADERRTFLPPALLRYWQLAMRHRWIVVGIISSCFVLGLVITLLMAPRYTGRAQLEISREQKQITKVEGLESQQAGQGNEFYATQYALLRTRPVAERVARELGLGRSAPFFEAHGYRDFLDRPEVKGDAKAAERMAVGLLLGNVTITPLRTSRLVDVSYTSRSPELSARIANAWAQAFIAGSMDRQYASTADARKFLEQRLENLRSRLEQSERQVVTFASANGIVTLDQTRDATGKTQTSRTLAAIDLEQLNEALARAVEQRVQVESRLRSTGELGAESISNMTLTNLRRDRADAAAEYARLMVQFEPDYPVAKGIAEKIKSLDAALARETRRISGSRQQEYREAVARENELRERLNRMKQQLDAQQRAGIQSAVYQREADTNRQLYDALLQRYKEIGIAGMTGISNIAVVEAAQVPTAPSAPNLVINLALSLLLGGVLAALTVFALEQIDEGVREPGQVQSELKVPLLGAVPTAEEDFERELQDVKSLVYEAYFSIRSNLSFSTTHGFPRTLMVTSSRPAEGKSSTSLALATVLGRTDRRVLLIDGDMRSPSIQDLVGCENSVGLSNLLSGEDNWSTLVRETALKNVSVITSGPVPPSAAELLSGDRLAMLLAQWGSAYDHVIIDSPPVLGLTDAPLLSRAVEGSIFVVESNGIAIRAIRASLARLHMAHAHVFGVVLTKVAQHRAGYGYGGGYGYGYGRRYGGSSDAA
jgi:succinoglycan biosynthesis transport protein ExoP